MLKTFQLFLQALKLVSADGGSFEQLLAVLALGRGQQAAASEEGEKCQLEEDRSVWGCTATHGLLRLVYRPGRAHGNLRPPPNFDQPLSRNAGSILSDDSATAEGSEDAWAELKPYLEAQTKSIV